ncbi:MAG: hypothetical protein FDZ70_10955, partial [Actinobacteria bacterium]
MRPRRLVPRRARGRAVHGHGRWTDRAAPLRLRRTAHRLARHARARDRRRHVLRWPERGDLRARERRPARAQRTVSVPASPIAAEIERLATARRLTCRFDALIEGPAGTAVIEALVADARGVLVVESRDWAGTAVRGAADNASWTVLRSGQAAAGYPNPILRNVERVDAVRAALAAAGAPVASDLVRGLVVLPDLDLSGLEVPSDGAFGVTRASDLGAYFERRATDPALPMLDPAVAG